MELDSLRVFKIHLSMPFSRDQMLDSCPKSNTPQGSLSNILCVLHILEECIRHNIVRHGTEMIRVYIKSGRS